MNFAIIISILNKKAFGLFLRKYTYNNYINIYYNIIYSIYICLKCTQFRKINAGNSLSEAFERQLWIHREGASQRLSLHQ